MSGIDKLFDSTTRGLEKALDLMFWRNQAITSNIANAETPQYRAVDVNFAGELERAFGAKTQDLSTSHTKHMNVTADSGLAHMGEDFSGATRGDGNNVDLDIQMGRLAFNSEKYSQAANLVGRKLSLIKRAITEFSR